MSDGTLTPPVGDDDHAMGPADAPATLVEFGDYECPSCGMAYPVLKAVQRTLGSHLRFVFRNFPLAEAHPHAEHAAEMAEAAGGQGKFWEMHDLIYENQQALRDADLLRYAGQLGLDTDRAYDELKEGVWVKRVRADFRSGVRSGVNGTPTFYINGARFDGDWTDPDAFVAALRAAAEV